MPKLTADHFSEIARIAHDRWGLNLSEGKRTLVEGRLTRFLVRAPFNSVDEFLAHLRAHPTEQDLLTFFDMLSTNTTSFFREPHHFDFLQAITYPRVAARSRRLRLWSAACSNGSEPYTLAMHALESLPDPTSWDIRVLATDLSTRSVEQASRGEYPEDALARVPEHMRKKYFGAADHSGQRRVSSQLRSHVAVHRLNLMDAPWPMSGPFDAIFCRNVMIYFDAPTRERLVNRMSELLGPEGVLVIGSAETLAGLKTPFRTLQPSVYGL